MTSLAQTTATAPQGTGSTAGQHGTAWLPVPDGSLGPVIPERGYLVEEIRDGLYWITEGMYQSLIYMAPSRDHRPPAGMQR